MSSQHRAVRTLLRDTATSLADNVVFTYARASAANQISKNKDHMIRLDPLNQSVDPTESGYNFTKTYKVGLVFYGYDKKDGTEEDTALVLDAMDELSDKFLNKLNLFTMGEDSELTQGSIAHEQVELKNITKQSFIKVFVDVLSGYIVQFDMVVPDTFDYCKIYG